MRYLVLVLIFLLGCQKQKEISIAANEWVGYAPIFYANEKGWLKKDNIRLIRTISLGESLELYQNGLVGGIAATNYEYNQIKDKVYPVILLDKSYGGDKVLSNKSIKELKKAKKIEAFLEVDSVNSLLLKAFLKSNNIPKSKIKIHNKDQQEIIKTNYDFKKPIIIVTYAPYDVTLKKMGFKEIASTKTDNSLLVVDAIFIDKKLYSKERFKILKQDIDKAIKEIQKDPQKAYQLIKQYYTNYSYEDFKKDLKNIKWINNPSKDLILKLQRIGFDTKELLK